MMGMFRDSLRWRLGEDFLVRDSGGGEENLRVARGDLGGSPYRSLVFWPLANRSSSDLREGRVGKEGSAWPGLGSSGFGGPRKGLDGLSWMGVYPAFSQPPGKLLPAEGLTAEVWG